jgi:hypothetical protein
VSARNEENKVRVRLMILHIPMKGQTRRSRLRSVPPSRDLARNVQGTEAVPSVQPVVGAATKPKVIGH